MAAIITAANRLELEYSPQLNQEAYEKADAPEVRGLALAGLYRHDPAKYRNWIDAWLGSMTLDERTAGVIAAGASREAGFGEIQGLLIIHQCLRMGMFIVNRDFYFESRFMSSQLKGGNGDIAA